MEKSQNLFNIFDLAQESYIRNWIWQDRFDSFGFTITKDYPTNIRFFKPAVTRTGRVDSVMMIKIAVLPEVVSGNFYNLHISVSTVSRYMVEKEDQFDREFHYEDENCPTEESLEKSARSREPISLTDTTKYKFNYIDNTLFDAEGNTAVAGVDIINYIYQKHLKTVNNTSGLLLRIKSKLKGKTSTGLFLSAKALSVSIFPLTGRKIENEYGNMPLIPFTYAINPREYEDNYGTPNHLLNLDGLLKITPLAAFISSFTLILLFTLSYYFEISLFKIVPFLKENKDSEVFSVALIVLIVLFWNRVLPFLLLKLLNGLIRFRQWVDYLKFKI